MENSVTIHILTLSQTSIKVEGEKWNLQKYSTKQRGNDTDLNRDSKSTKAAAGRHPQRLLCLSKEERRSELNHHCLPQHLLISLMVVKISQRL